MAGKKDSTQVLVATGELLDPHPARIPLHDSHAVRREMSSVYRDARCGRIEVGAGTRLTYILDRLLRALETSDLQDRLELLEATLKARNHERP